MSQEDPATLPAFQIGDKVCHVCGMGDELGIVMGVVTRPREVNYIVSWPGIVPAEREHRLEEIARPEDLIEMQGAAAFEEPEPHDPGEEWKQ